ncbi:hypothetical protein [Microlunatus sp. Y2014]|uniref:hypothetical protein n=1 Tax=Microlunatus sp. Y2014 TaxID=3418488 RepID=UPI003DA78A7C
MQPRPAPTVPGTADAPARRARRAVHRLGAPLLVLLLITLTACTGGTPPSPDPGPGEESATGTTTPPSTGTTTPPSAEASPTDDDLGREPITETEEFTDAEGLRAFTSPSGRIVCVLNNAGDTSLVRCDLPDTEWTIEQPEGESCDPGVWPGGGPGAYAVLSIATPDLQPGPICVGDPLGAIPEGERPVLEYGHAITNNELTCVSERAGIRCEGVETTNGFRMSLEEAQFYCEVDGRVQLVAPGARPCRS